MPGVSLCAYVCVRGRRWVVVWGVYPWKNDVGARGGEREEARKSVGCGGRRRRGRTNKTKIVSSWLPHSKILVRVKPYVRIKIDQINEEKDQKLTTMTVFSKLFKYSSSHSTIH